MKLTKIQLKTLQFYHLFRGETPTIRRWMAFNWFAWLPLLAIGFVGFLLTFVPGTVFGWLVIGMAAGAFFRDVGRARSMERVWPLYLEIINWQRVTELLEKKDKPDA
jgi:hypothetical protein